MRARLAALSPDVVATRSATMVDHLVQQPEYRRANVLMIYLALPGEVDLRTLALHAWRHGKRVAAPRVDWNARRLIPCFIESLSDNIESGPRGVSQPAEAAPVCALEEIDLVLTPGLAFDALCYRLGRGAGFYDRFLAEPSLRAASCGAAFQEQLVDAVPRDPWDRPLSLLVTDAGVIRAGGP